MTPQIILPLYCLLVIAASLLGGWAPMFIRLTHRRMQLAISAIAGFMLGVGLLLMLPHALLAAGRIQAVVSLTLAGFLVMFFIERIFAYHHHEIPQSDPPSTAAQPLAALHNDHQHPSAFPHSTTSITHPLTWSGAAIGLTLHSLLDGLALAAAVAAAHPEQASSPATSLAGLAVFLVIFFHRPFDAMTLVTLMASGGWSVPARHLVNALFALAIPLGALLFHLGLSSWPHQHEATGYALAFSAGTFLCIASSDLLPELHFHRHDRLALSTALLLGLAVAVAITTFDLHQHEHTLPSPSYTSPHIHEPSHP